MILYLWVELPSAGCSRLRSWYTRHVTISHSAHSTFLQDRKGNLLLQKMHVYYLSKKPWSIVYSKLLYKKGQDFLENVPRNHYARAKISFRQKWSSILHIIVKTTLIKRLIVKPRCAFKKKNLIAVLNKLTIPFYNLLTEWGKVPLRCSEPNVNEDVPARCDWAGVPGSPWTPPGYRCSLGGSNLAIVNHEKNSLRIRIVYCFVFCFLWRGEGGYLNPNYDFFINRNHIVDLYYICYPELQIYKLGNQEIFWWILYKGSRKKNLFLLARPLRGGR